MGNLIYNIYFEVAGVIVSFAVLIFIQTQYTGSKSISRFKMLLLANILAGGLDALTVVFYTYPDLIPRWADFLLNSLGFIAGATEGAVFIGYINSYLENKGEEKLVKRIGAINAVVISVYTVMFIFNAVNPFIFNFDENGYYQRIGAYPIVYIVPALYILCATVYIILKRKKFSGKQMTALVLFVVLQLSGMLIQMLFIPDVFIIYFVSSIALVAMSYALETPDYLLLVKTMKELEEAKEEAEFATKAKDNFLANMSHEIRTPLNAILGMDEMILRESKDPKTRKYAGNVRSAGNTLLSLINDILDFSKIESGKMELVEVDYQLASIINDVVNMTKKKALDKGLEYNVKVPADIPTRLFGDEIRFRQIMINLINNAIKYTNEGQVTAVISYEYVDKPKAKTKDKSKAVSQYDKTIKITLKVMDTGIGIREDEMSKLFQSFQRLDETRNRKVEGTGLGLVLTKQLVELMGGTIGVSSTYGRGSTFTAVIMQDVADATPMGELEAALERASDTIHEYIPTLYAPEAKVLIVDDNEMNLQVVGDLLSDTKMKIDYAKSGYDCVMMCSKGQYDLIFMDQMMPDLDGAQTLQIIKERGMIDNTPVIALTADAIVGAKASYIRMGFNDYLSKPIIYEQLEKMLFQYLPDDKTSRLNREATPNGIAVDVDNKFKLLVVDKSVDNLKMHRARLSAYDASFMFDMGKVDKFAAGHDLEYVMTRVEDLKEVTETIDMAKGGI